MRLRAGVNLPFITGTKLADIDQFLANAGKHHFWMQSKAVAFPDFNNVESFIERLAKAGLLQRDIIVEDALAEKL